MIVASGGPPSRRAIADHLVQDLKDKACGNARVEGLPACDWVLIDAGDIMIHVFRPEVASSTTSRRWGRRPLERRAG